MERIKKVDLESVSEEQFEIIQEMLNKKMTEIVNKAVSDANKYLNVYGIQARMVLELKPVQPISQDQNLNRED